MGLGALLVFEFVLLVGDDLAADAAVSYGDVGVFGVAGAVVPVLRPGPALRAYGAVVVAVGEGFGAVSGCPGAVTDAAELRVRDAPPVAQFEFAA